MPINDTHEFSKLYDRCSPLAYGLAFRILRNETEAQDVLQQAFITLWQRREEFDPEKGKVTTWLYIFVRNRCIDLLRRKRNENSVSLDGESALLDILFDHGSLDDVELKNSIGEALKKLPDPQHQVIEAAFFEGRTQQEISERTGEPLGTIKTRMRLGLLKLAEGLKAEDLKKEASLS